MLRLPRRPRSEQAPSWQLPQVLSIGPDSTHQGSTQQEGQAQQQKTIGWTSFSRDMDNAIKEQQ